MTSLRAIDMARLLLCGAAWLTFFISGCTGGKPDGGDVEPSAAVLRPYVPAEVELGEPTAYFQAPDIVRVEIPYKFVAGTPVAHYGCEVKFLDSDFKGQKYLQAWELKNEGVIRDGFVIGNEPKGAFEVTFTEAESPDKGYHPISKVATGQVGPAK